MGNSIFRRFAGVALLAAAMAVFGAGTALACPKKSDGSCKNPGATCTTAAGATGLCGHDPQNVCFCDGLSALDPEPGPGRP